MVEFEELPEGCISDILSRTTPVDAGRLSLVSKTFRSAADSDAVWNQFLPSDTNLIISQSPSLANIPTKKSLYLALSHRPIIIDHGKKSFQLDRKSGKKCYMLAARSLSIIWGDDRRYWNWIVMPQSRFPEVAKLCFVWWLEIRGMINSFSLSPNTRYVAYLVFKMIEAYGFESERVEISVGIEGGESNTKYVCLYPNEERRVHMHDEVVRRHNRGTRLHDNVVGLQRPSVRSDGWLEIEMGEFLNSSLEDEVQMSVTEIKSGRVKGNFYLEGIEFRPKEYN